MSSLQQFQTECFSQQICKISSNLIKSCVSLYSLPAKPKKITLNYWRQSFAEKIPMENSDNSVPAAGFVLKISVLCNCCGLIYLLKSVCIQVVLRDKYMPFQWCFFIWENLTEYFSTRLGSCYSLNKACSPLFFM